MILQVDKIKFEVIRLTSKLGHPIGPLSIIKSFMDLQRDYWIGLNKDNQRRLTPCHNQICKKVVKWNNQPHLEKLIFFPEDRSWEWLPALIEVY